MQTFTNLPPLIADATAKILSRSDVRELSTDAKLLHDRYMTEDKERNSTYLKGPKDMLAYLSLRFPATYAQLMGALFQIKERIPNWEPKTMLDLGCGPATGMFAAKEVFPSITTAMGIDRERYFLSIGEELLYESKLDMKATWEQKTIPSFLDASQEAKYDLIIISNVLNELTVELREQLVEKLIECSSGVVLLLEAGNNRGSQIIQKTAQDLSEKQTLIAPYLNNTFVKKEDFWVHFPQRFIRPEFQRRIRQSMRESDLMASDWEEAKYSFVAFGNVPIGNNMYGVCVGAVQKYHGYITLPVLTADGIQEIKVMKRHKEQYRLAKEIKWGENIENKEALIFTPTT
ncbi:MAG: small ribosomal subunit Rsm22 family protein [Patescibacteria group bacterium]